MWERLPTETDLAWSAFVVYRDMGPKRNLTKTAGELGKHVQSVSLWNMKHRWAERARAYDASIGEEVRQQLIAERYLIAKEHIDELRAMRAIGMEALGMVDPYKLAQDPNAARLFVTEPQKAERQLLGLEKAEEQQSGGVVVILDSSVVPGPTTTPRDLRSDATVIDAE